MKIMTVRGYKGSEGTNKNYERPGEDLRRVVL